MIHDIKTISGPSADYPTVFILNVNQINALFLYLLPITIKTNTYLLCK